MRAREPDVQGSIDRGGVVAVAYEVFDGPERSETTGVFVPIDPIVHSRAWKGQVPYLALHYRVVARGSARRRAALT